MLVIRTAEEMARALASPLDPTLLARLVAQQEYLTAYPDYSFEELGLFIVVDTVDRLSDLQQQTTSRLVEGATFAIEPEAVDRHGPWLEVLFILSDDGFGLVLWLPLDGTLHSTMKAAVDGLMGNRPLHDQTAADLSTTTTDQLEAAPLSNSLTHPKPELSPSGSPHAASFGAPFLILKGMHHVKSSHDRRHRRRH